MPELVDLDTQELLDQLPDPVSVAVGSRHYVQNHRVDDLRIRTPDGGYSPRLRVSRYYWDLEPSVAVDFLQDLRMGEIELATKKAYFARQGTRYALVKDAYDGETLEAVLQADTPEGEVPVVTQASQVLVGPRRRRS